MPLALSIRRRYSYAIGEDSGGDSRGGVLDDGDARRRPARTRVRSPNHASARDADDDHGPEAAGIDNDDARAECWQHASVDDPQYNGHRGNQDDHHRWNDDGRHDAVAADRGYAP